MSYDISVIKVVHSSNYTYNICEMFNQALNQLQTEKLLPKYYTDWTDVFMFKDNNNELTLLIKELKSKPEYYKKYNPENGWGDYTTALEWIEEINKNWKKGYNIRVD